MSQINLTQTAERALARMTAQGFEHAQVGASLARRDELNVAHNEPSLLRSTETPRLSLVGIVDGRRAATELSVFDDAAVAQAVADLFDAARSAPQDDANAVSAGQIATIEQGPLEGDLALMADKVRELLDFRAAETPKMMIEEGLAAHRRVDAHTLTSGGSVLSCRLGNYEMSAFGTAREGARASSFNYTGGECHDLATQHASEWFGIGEMLRDTERQIDTRRIPERFVGEVVLAPQAVSDLVDWLLGQLGDEMLISGTSLYRDKVGQAVASAKLTLTSRFDAPGVAALSGDAFATPAVEPLVGGVLKTLTPSLYGSRKTNLPHVPVAGGWALAAGETPRSQLLAGVERGAWVGRLSMGRPASNGDFSGVIKNSFFVEDGALGTALSETMISGNIAQMLRDVVAVSRERLDTGARVLPWLRVAGLHFS